MRIIGPDALVFGVDDVCGLRPVPDRLWADAGRRRCTGRQIRSAGRHGDRHSSIRTIPTLPKAFETASMLRETVYGVADDATLNAIETELAQGSRSAAHLRRCSCTSSMTWASRWRSSSPCAGRSICRARRSTRPAPTPQRPPNELGVEPDVDPKPRTLSHVVYFVPDAAKAERFYRTAWIRHDGSLHACRALHAAGGHARPPHVVHDPDAAFHEGLRALHLPRRRTDRDDARRSALQREGLSDVLGTGTSSLRLELVLVFQQPARVPRRVRRRHGLARRLLDSARGADGRGPSQLFLFSLRDKWAPSGPPPPKGVG